MQPSYGAPPPAAKKTPVWIIVLVVVAGAGLVLVVTFVSLAIYGTRRYIAAAKTAEAKNSVSAISRAAAAAYDRESVGAGVGVQHALCKTAVPVPATVPTGVKYMPVASGGDFDTGDAETGWRCLKFAITMMPIYYQYRYQQGSGYQARAVDPGPDGFEASARGDLDGDGATSLFALSGQPASGTMRVGKQIHIEDELE